MMTSMAVDHGCLRLELAVAGSHSVSILDDMLTVQSWRANRLPRVNRGSPVA